MRKWTMYPVVCLNKEIIIKPVKPLSRFQGGIRYLPDGKSSEKSRI